MKRTNQHRVHLVMIFAALSASCANVISLRPDNQWRAIYAIQAADTHRTLQLETARVDGRACDSDGPRQRTQVRIVQLVAFMRYAELPDTLPSGTNIGVELRDSGPLDMTLFGATRIVPMFTGKELLARTQDPCIGLRVKEIKADTQSTSTKEWSNE